MNESGAYQYTFLCVVILVLSLAFSAFKEMPARKKKLYLFLSLGILAILTMFRSYSVGNDTSNYIAMFNRIASSNIITYLRSSYTEPGFLVLNWILSRISRNPQILFIVTGAFIYISIGRFLNKWAKMPGMVVYLFVAMMQFDFLLSAMRQAIAIAILLFAFDFVVEKKPFKFVLTTLFAICFHNSAWIFLIAYPIVKSHYSINKSPIMFYGCLSVVMALCAMFFEKVLILLLSLFPKYSYYIGSTLFDGEPRLAILLKILVFSLMIITSLIILQNHYGASSELDFQRVTHRYSAINLSTLIIASNATALARLCGIFFIYPLLQYSNALSVLKHRNYDDGVLISLITVILFYIYGLVIVLLKTPEWYTTYPYLFCF